jgi:Tol biopolymer transport system component
VAPRPSFAEPGISPDGREIAFVSGGDIWTVPAAGGEARLLVSHQATESRPLYAPDGRHLAFTSTRSGGGDIYVLDLGTGEVARLTWDDGPEVLDGWSADGRWVYFTSSTLDIAGMNDVLRVSREGGTPLPVTADRYTSEFFSAESPDGRTLAFSARGNAAAQWWRHGHSHLDESEIWIRTDASDSYTRLVERGARSLWPMWAPDGNTIYFVSDRDGPENGWAWRSGSPAAKLTSFTDGRVLWPSITRDGRTVAIERDFAIWTVDTATGRSAPVSIVRRGAPQGPGVEHRRLTSDFDELALSPDGKKVAFVVRGEIFGASAKDGGDAARVTRSPAVESQVTDLPVRLHHRH